MSKTSKLKEFTVLAVGELFTLIKDTKHLGKDGVILELLEGEDKGDWFIMIHLTNMSSKEVNELRNSKITVKLIKEGKGYILPMMGYKNLQFSLIFDPMKYKDKRKKLLFNLNKIGNMITIVGIESTTNVIKTLRYANMPRKLYISLMQQHDYAKEIKGFSKKYDNWVTDLYSRYDDNQLWDMAEYIGKMGEL